MQKKISSRGRKREARRWLEEIGGRCARIYPVSDGFAARCWEMEQLRERDPALAAAVDEIVHDDFCQAASMSYEQWHTRFIRRVEKRRRAEAAAQPASTTR